MEKITFYGVKVYGAIHIRNRKRQNNTQIYNKLRLEMEPDMYSLFKKKLDDAYRWMKLLPGYIPNRQSYMPVQRLTNGNYRVAVRSGQNDKKYTDAEAAELERAAAIDCTIRLDAYATNCNQGVRCRLVDYKVVERRED